MKPTTYSAFVKFELAAKVDPTSALKTLTSLKGIGPATASLLLSVAYPKLVPFFGDELFQWLCGGDGEKRKMKYDAKEYRELWDEAMTMRRKLEREGREVRADEVEKVGFVCGHWDVVGKAEEMLESSSELKKVETEVENGQAEEEDKETAPLELEEVKAKKVESKEEKQGERKAETEVIEGKKTTAKRQSDNSGEEGLRRSKRARR